MRSDASRMNLIDALKGIGSQLIVLHHLAFYGPMSDAALPIAPDFIAWLHDYGRMAVQVFLVIAGFLAARALAPNGVLLATRPWALIGRRYFSLILPFVAALGVAIIGAALARSLMDHDSIPLAPSIGQVLAHALLLHNIVGSEALSAGVWYIAIDFQLFALLVGLLALARALGERLGHANRWALGLVALLALAALTSFNRDPELNIWGIYFFGSYGLGIFAYWASQQRRLKVWMGAMFAVGVYALLLDYRVRIAVALCLALLLATATRSGLMQRPQQALVAWLGKISYSVFLVHFPVCLVVNALMHRLDAESPVFNAFGMLLAWGLSIAAGALFYARVERPVRSVQWGVRIPRRWVLFALTTGLGVGIAVKPLL